jgi:molybdopterin/thiamine biosynthesis adenylyltransferase
MTNPYIKYILVMAAAGFSGLAMAESPGEAPIDADIQSEAISTNVAYCTTGKCFNHVNDINLTENRYNEFLKVTGIVEDRQSNLQHNFGLPAKSTK